MTYKIKVVHLISQFGTGGAENGIINIANHIDTERFEMSICAFAGSGSQISRLDPNRTKYYQIEKRPGNDFKLPFRLIQLFKELRPDIIHTHAWGTLCEGLIAAKAASIPAIIHGEHGTLQRKKGNIYVQRFAWRFADMVLSVSRNHAEQIAESIGFPKNRITVIANGVDTMRFNPEINGASLKNELQLKKEDIVIGTVGRLVDVKNHYLLISAFAKLSKFWPNIRLVIVGDGPLRDDLAKFAALWGCATKTHFLGRRSDVAHILAGMDIFALTSHNEGMSNTILEAMSSGIPVVATAVGGNPELVVNEATGILFAPNDLDQLIEALESLIHDPAKRKKWGEAGRARTIEKFSLEVMVRRYEQIYQLCLKNQY